MTDLENNNQELIRKYFSQTLTKEEAKIFETKILKDKEFAEDVAFQKTLQKVVNLPDQVIQEQMQSSPAPVLPLKPNDKKDSSRELKYWIAAILIALIGGLLFLFLSGPGHVSQDTSNTPIIPNNLTNQIPSEQIASFDMQPNGIPIPGINLDAKSPETQKLIGIIQPYQLPYKKIEFAQNHEALAYYQNDFFQQFLNVFPDFFNLLATDDEAKAEILKGSAQLFLGNIEGAAQTLSAVLNKTQAKAFHPEAHFYLGLTQIYQDKFEEAKSNLAAVKSGEQQESASAILKALAEI